MSHREEKLFFFLDPPSPECQLYAQKNVFVKLDHGATVARTPSIPLAISNQTEHNWCGDEKFGKKTSARRWKWCELILEGTCVHGGAKSIRWKNHSKFALHTYQRARVFQWERISLFPGKFSLVTSPFSRRNSFSSSSALRWHATRYNVSKKSELITRRMWKFYLHTHTMEYN